MLTAGLHEPGNVSRRIPVVGIKESHGLHTKANGVEAADKSRCLADVVVAHRQNHMMSLPMVQFGYRFTIGH